MNAITLATRSWTEANSPRLSSRRARIEKNSSTWCSHEAWVGVEWGWNRWWLSHHQRVASAIGGGAVVEHQVDVQLGRDLGVQVVEEVDEVPGGVAVQVGGLN